MRNKIILGILAALMLIMGGCGGKGDAFTYKGVPMLPEGQLAMIDGKLYGRPYVFGKMTNTDNNYDKLACYDIYAKKSTVLKDGENVYYNPRIGVLIGDYIYNVSTWDGSVNICKIGVKYNTFEVFAEFSGYGPNDAARIDDRLLVSEASGNKSYIWEFDVESGERTTLISKSDKDGFSIRSFDYDEKNEKIVVSLRDSKLFSHSILEIYSKEGELERSIELDFLQGVGSDLRVMGEYIYISGSSSLIARFEGDELVPVIKISWENYVNGRFSSFHAAKDWGGERREGLEFFYATEYPYLFIFDYETGEMKYIDFKEIYGFDFIGPVLPEGDNVWFFRGKGWSISKDYYYYPIDELMKLDMREFPRDENGEYDAKALMDKYAEG